MWFRVGIRCPFFISVTSALAPLPALRFRSALRRLPSHPGPPVDRQRPPDPSPSGEAVLFHTHSEFTGPQVSGALGSRPLEPAFQWGCGGGHRQAVDLVTECSRGGDGGRGQWGCDETEGSQQNQRTPSLQRFLVPA